MLEPQCVDGNAEANERWLDVRGYEGRYQVSDLGRVKSLARFRGGKKGCKVPIKEKVMRLDIKKDAGRSRPYAQIALRDGGPRTKCARQFLVHRLVADAFIKPLEPGEQVDHINGIHNDNRAVNLRVMHFVEHARMHPTVLNPPPRSQETGCFMKRAP